jgi:type 1 glutamine amidotransferase
MCREWRMPLRTSVLCIALAGALVGGTATVAAAFDVLVFSRTAGFRHGSIPDGIAAIQELGATKGFSVTATEDASVFAPAALAQFAVVVFLNTTGDVLDDDQQAAFETWFRDGGGWVGVHSAADTEYDWAWYHGLIGAYFQDHPAIQTAMLDVEDASHPSTAHLPLRFARTDEWYNFRTNPRGAVHVLLRLDETTYLPGPGAMGSDHPIAWCHQYDGGRAWYTAGGHTAAAYAEPEFRAHLLGGITSAAAAAGGPPCGATATTSTSTTTTLASSTTTTSLAPNPSQPLAGHRLLLRGRRGRTVLKARSRDRTLETSQKQPAEDPTLTGARLHVLAATGATPVTFELPPEQWRRLGQNGWRARAAKGTAAVTSVTVRDRHGLRLVADDPSLAALLVTDPDTITIVLELGTRRFCLEFAGTTFQPEHVFRAGPAPPPEACP